MHSIMLNGLKLKWTNLSHAQIEAIGDKNKGMEAREMHARVLAHQLSIRTQLSKGIERMKYGVQWHMFQH